MKICMLLDNPITRDPRVKGEAEALAAAGHEVTVYGTQGNALPERERWNGVEFVRIPTASLVTRSSKLGRALRSLPAILGGVSAFKARYRSTTLRATERLYENAVAGGDFDVFHAHDIHLLRAAANAAHDAGAKLVYDSHEYFRMDYFDKGRKLPAADIAHYSELLASQEVNINKADLVITVCDNIAHGMQKDFSLKQAPLVLYNCAALRERARMNILREEYLHTANERAVVLYQGAVSWGRGLEQFVRLAAGNPESDFVIIGPVSKRSLYERLQQLAQGCSNVHFLEPVPYEKLWQITASADYGFSYLEPMNASYEMAVGNKLFEYLAAGLPVFTRASLGTIEICDKIVARFPREDLPLIALPEDESAQPEYVRSVISGGRREVYSETAYRVAETMFNRTLEFGKLIEAYEKLGEK